MDGSRFDAITTALVLSPSRRTVLRLLTGGTLGALTTGLGRREAEATHFTCRHIDTRCRRGRQCCSGICRRKRCRGHDAGICTGEDICRCEGPAANSLCVCLVTTGDAPFCGVSFFCQQCERDKDCEARLGPGSACVRITAGTGCVTGCADTGGTACSRPCPDPA